MISHSTNSSSTSSPPLYTTHASPFPTMTSADSIMMVVVIVVLLVVATAYFFLCLHLLCRRALHCGVVSEEGVVQVTSAPLQLTDGDRGPRSRRRARPGEEAGTTPPAYWTPPPCYSAAAGSLPSYSCALRRTVEVVGGGPLHCRITVVKGGSHLPLECLFSSPNLNGSPSFPFQCQPGDDTAASNHNNNFEPPSADHPINEAAHSLPPPAAAASHLPPTATRSQTFTPANILPPLRILSNYSTSSSPQNLPRNNGDLESPGDPPVASAAPHDHPSTATTPSNSPPAAVEETGEENRLKVGVPAPHRPQNKDQQTGEETLKLTEPHFPSSSVSLPPGESSEAAWEGPEENRPVRLWVRGGPEEEQQLVLALRTPKTPCFVAYWTPPTPDSTRSLHLQVVVEPEQQEVDSVFVEVLDRRGVRLTFVPLSRDVPSLLSPST